jgi:DNA-binding HxlR family transcriptional regulator
MEEPPLDEYCKKILAILLLLRRKIRFNELYRFLNQHGVKISKPTLSEHLKHLTKLKILVRQEEGIQKVTYRINSERFEKRRKQ